MKRGLIASVVLLPFGATTAHAHRLDEYLQATTILVGVNRVQLQLRLTPGVAVLKSVLAEIDANADGTISDAEREAYARRALRDVSLAVDGQALSINLLAWKFGTLADMREGRGDIEIDVDAVVPRGGAARQLTFDNRHQRAISVYLVNALVPRDPAIHIAQQHRSDDQASYAVDYSQPESAPAAPWWRGTLGWLMVLTVLSVMQLAHFATTGRGSLKPGAQG